MSESKGARGGRIQRIEPDVDKRDTNPYNFWFKTEFIEGGLRVTLFQKSSGGDEFPSSCYFDYDGEAFERLKSFAKGDTITLDNKPMKGNCNAYLAAEHLLSERFSRAQRRLYAIVRREYAKTGIVGIFTGYKTKERLNRAINEHSVPCNQRELYLIIRDMVHLSAAWKLFLQVGCYGKPYGVEMTESVCPTMLSSSPSLALR